MSAVRSPLLRNGGNRVVREGLDSDKIKDMAFEITGRGKAVLNGDADFIALNGIDTWLGGVHLTNTNLWRWDEENGRLRKAAAR